MFSLPSQTRLNSGNRARDNAGSNPLQRLPVLYPRHGVISSISSPRTSLPRRSAAVLNETIYDYSVDHAQRLYRKEQLDNLVYPRLAARAVTPFPNGLQTPVSLLGSIPVDAALRETTNKRPRLSRDPYNQFVTPSLVHSPSLTTRTSVDHEKLSAIGFGRGLNQVIPNCSRSLSGYFADQIYAQQLLASRNSLTSMNLQMNTKDLKPQLPHTNENPPMSVSLLNPGSLISSVQSTAQFAFPTESRNSNLGADHRSSSVSLSLSSNSSGAVISTNFKPISMNQTGNEAVTHRMVVFKHEPRKRKSQHLTISSVSSLVSPGLNTVKQESLDSAQTTAPVSSNNEVHSLVTSQSTRPSDSQVSISVSTSTFISTDSGISVGSSRDQIHPTVTVPLSRPQSVFIQLSGSGNANSSTPAVPTSAKRPILPGPVKMFTQSVMSTSPSPTLRLQMSLNERNEFIQHPSVLLSTKHKVQPSASKSIASSTESVYCPTSFGASTTTTSHCGTVIIPPSVDDVLWGRKFFGKSNPQQLIYTLVYLYARTFGLWTGEQLGRLRFGPRSQFTFVLLKPGETTKPIELLPPSSGYQFTAIDSNLFRADSKPLLLLPRLRLLYIHEGDETEIDETSDVAQHGDLSTAHSVTQSVKRPSKSASPGRSITKRYLIDHFDANDHERCVLCYHAFYLSKRPSFESDPDRDQYFLAWQSNPTSGHWFRTYPIEARCLSLIVQTIRTALDCAELAQRRSVPAPSSTEQFLAHVSHGDGSTDSPGPLNLVIREHTAEAPSVKNTKSHPTCLDYWPELTERARQSPWQCSDCKTCNVCHGKEFETELLVCDACDKGFHSECHVPKLQEPVDRSLPWVCADCQKEGYSVAIGTLPGAADGAFPAPHSTAGQNGTTEHGSSCDPDSTPSMAMNKCSGNSDATEPTSEPLAHTTESNPTVPTSLSREQFTSTTTPDRRANGTSCSNSATPTSPTATQNKSSELSTNTTDSSQLESKTPTRPSTSSTPVVEEAPPTSRVHDSPVSSSQAACPSHACESTHKPEGLTGSSPPEAHTSSSIEKSPDQSSVASSSRRRPTTPIDHEPKVPHQPPPEQTGFPTPTDRAAECVRLLDEASASSHPDPIACAPRPDDIRAWSVDHVRDWLLEEGFPREAEAFSQQEIDGACLLLMKRMDVLTELGIKLGPAVKIYERIKRLQSRCTSPTILCT